MPSFSTSLSGLNASSSALAVIANDLANLNTVGYKSITPRFTDLFYQQVGTSGAGNPVQIGVGTVMNSTSSNFTQGNIDSTGAATDLAIQGDGFFVVSKNGLLVYTRTGNFSQDPDGYLVSEDGGRLQGYSASNGVVETNQPIGDLVIQSGQLSPPQTTSNVQLTLNLDASAADPVKATGTFTLSGNPADGEAVTIGSTTYTFRPTLSSGPTVANEVLIGATAADTLANLKGAINHETTGGQTEGTTYSTGTMANTSATAASATATTVALEAVAGGTSGNEIATTETVANGSFAATTLTGGTSSTFSTSVAVYDALGASHVLTFTFSKTSANNWDYQITLPAADTGGTGSPPILHSGTLVFDGAGTLTSPSANISPIEITGLANGAQNLSFNWNLFDAANVPVITQVAGSSAASATSQDGYASGSLLSFSIDSSGVIQGSFSNGQTLALGQVALATFPNSQGLSRQGANNYLASLASGLPNVGVPGTGGRGTVSGGALEASNVDIAREFALLIVAQRGYQANARAITTADEVTQEAINLKR